VNQSYKGVILSMFYYGYVLSQVLGGLPTQRIGGRRVLHFFYYHFIRIVVFDMWFNSTGFQQSNHSDPFSTIFFAAQGFIFPAIHTLLAQWVPPQERSRSVSFTTSGIYLAI
jgi:MFS family permease